MGGSVEDDSEIIKVSPIERAVELSAIDYGVKLKEVYYETIASLESKPSEGYKEALKKMSIKEIRKFYVDNDIKMMDYLKALPRRCLSISLEKVKTQIMLKS